MWSGLFTVNKNLEFVVAREIPRFRSSPSRMWDCHLVIHSGKERRTSFVPSFMLKNTEYFFFVRMRSNFILVVKLRLRRPTAIYSRGDIFVRPINERRQFFPVVHLFKRAVL